LFAVRQAGYRGRRTGARVVRSSTSPLERISAIDSDGYVYVVNDPGEEVHRVQKLGSFFAPGASRVMAPESSIILKRWLFIPMEICI
jgi:hypothetical protein